VSAEAERAPTQRRWAYSVNGFTRRPLLEALSCVASAGFTGLELLADAPHWLPSAYADSSWAAARLGCSPAELKRALNDHGLWISNINANTAMLCWPRWMPETVFEPALSHPDPQVRRRRIELTRRAMDWALELGAPRLSVTSGRCPGGCPPDEGIAYLADSLAELCERAEQLGLDLSLEYEPGLLIERWPELRGLIERVDHPRLGANLDLGHARCAGEDPVEAIKGLAGFIWSVHLEDIRGSKHYHLIPGEGDMDLQAALLALDEVGYQGPLTVELYTYAELPNDGDLRAAQSAYQALKRLD